MNVDRLGLTGITTGSFKACFIMLILLISFFQQKFMFLSKSNHFSSSSTVQLLGVSSKQIRIDESIIKNNGKIAEINK